MSKMAFSKPLILLALGLVQAALGDLEVEESSCSLLQTSLDHVSQTKLEGTPFDEYFSKTKKPEAYYERKSDEGFRMTLWLMMLIHVLYALAAAFYEVYTARSQAGPRFCVAEAEAGRCVSWDLVKLVSMLGVVWFHTRYYITRNAESVFLDRNMFLFLDTLSNSFSSWCLEGFMFVSGVFGQSMDPGSLSRCVIACGLAYVMTTPFWYFLDPNLVWTGERWYLIVLPLLRVVYSGLFWIARRFGVPLALPLFICYMIPLVITNKLGSMLTTFAMASMHWPYFALGCLFPAKTWTAFFTNHRVQLFSMLFLVLWWFLHAYSNDLRQWNDVACFWDGPCGLGYYHPWTIAPAWKDLKYFALKTPLLISWVGSIFFVSEALQKHFPGVADLACACGSRTLYCYLLHWLFVNRMVANFVPTTAVTEFKHGSFLILWSLMIPPVVTFSMSSKLTEAIFQPILLPALPRLKPKPKAPSKTEQA